MDENPTRICELIVGLGEMEVLGIDDASGGPLAMHIRSRSRPVCGGCGRAVWSKGARFRWGWWIRRRLGPCAPHVAQVAVAVPGGNCDVGSFTEVDE